MEGAAGLPMNVIFWLLIGGFVGWAARTSMGTGDRQGLAINVAIGMTGAVLGGWLLSSRIEPATFSASVLTASGLAVAFVGAVILLALAKLARLA